jgi:hypothetical protein
MSIINLASCAGSRGHLRRLSNANSMMPAKDERKSLPYSKEPTTRKSGLVIEIDYWEKT